MEATNEKPVSDNVLKTPVWMMVIRGFAMLISLIIFGLCARLMHDAYLDEEGFSLAVALLTWLATLYIILTEKIAGLQKFYNIIAVLVLDGLFMILWLAAFAATAARRAKFRYHVDVGDCSDDGSLFDSKSCTIVKRGVILFKTGLAIFAAIAGLGAIVWLLFIASFVWTLLAYLRGRKEGRFAMGSGTGSSTPSNNYQMENKIAESQPMNSPQGYPPQQQFQQNPPTEYVSPVQQNYPQGQFQQPHPTQSPYQNQTAYPPPQQQQQQFQGQQNFQQYPPQQQPYQQPIQPQMTGQQQQQPVQPQMTGQSQPYGSELSGSDMYQSPPHPAVSPPPQQYHTPPPQQYQTPPPQQPQQYQQYQQQ